MDSLQLIIALCMGLALSAACGFRVFVPLLVTGLTVRLTGLPVSEALAWTAGDAALICLSAATVVEIIAYYIPFIDNLLDTVSTPMAMVAGTLVMSGLLVGMPDYMQWGIGIVGGAGSAALIQTGTAALRGLSSASTGGLANSVLATVENALATIGAVLAVLLPLMAVAGLALLIFLVFFIVYRIRASRAAA